MKPRRVFSLGNRRPDEEERTYGTNDVAHVARVSLRQLQWWDERKIIMAAKVGHSRQYTEDDVIEIIAVAALRRKGLSLQMIRRGLRKLSRDLHAYKRVLIDGGDVLIAASGSSVAVFLNHASVIQHIRDSNDGWVLVSLRRELNGAAA